MKPIDTALPFQVAGGQAAAGRPESVDSDAMPASGPCALCGDRRTRQVADRDRDGAPLCSVLCLGCGLVRVDPLPDPAAIERFYADDYRSRYKGAYQPRPRHCYRETLRAIERVEQLLPLVRPGMRVLDVGAGAGFFAYAAGRRGIAVDGIEPNRAYAEFGRATLGQHAIRTGTLDQVDQVYDLITIHHVFEHLHDPVGSMRRLFDCTRSSGRVLLEVPNIEACYHAPGHVFHVAHLFWYSPATISALARRCGFEVESLTLAPNTSHIRLQLRRPGADDTVAADWRDGLSGNALRVLGLLGSRRRWRHYLSAVPYRRWFARMSRYAAEYRHSRAAEPAGLVARICDDWLGRDAGPIATAGSG